MLVRSRRQSVVALGRGAVGKEKIYKECLGVEKE